MVAIDDDEKLQMAATVLLSIAGFFGGVLGICITAERASRCVRLLVTSKAKGDECRQPLAGEPLS